MGTSSLGGGVSIAQCLEGLLTEYGEKEQGGKARKGPCAR